MEQATYCVSYVFHTTDHSFGTPCVIAAPPKFRRHRDHYQHLRTQVLGRHSQDMLMAGLSAAESCITPEAEEWLAYQVMPTHHMVCSPDKDMRQIVGDKHLTTHSEQDTHGDMETEKIVVPSLVVGT